MKQHNIPYHHIWSAKEFLLRPERALQRMLAGQPTELKGKGRLAERILPAVFVEDSDKHLAKLAPIKDKVQLFLLNHPYNKGFSIPGVERVYSWPEIYEKIQALKGSLIGV